MSVALLQNREHEHEHEILDDRESAFHVLTWSALRYTAHSHQDNMESYIKPYDEVDVHRNGKVSGGARKSVMIYDFIHLLFTN